MSLALLEKILPPYKWAALCHWQVEPDGDKTRIRGACPFCHKGALYFDPRDITCSNPRCTYGSGTVLDLVAAGLKGNYSEAVKLLSKHDPQLQAQSGTSAKIQTWAASADILRQIRNRVNALIRKPSTAAWEVTLEASLGRFEIKREQVPGVFIVTTGAEFNRQLYPILPTTSKAQLLSPDSKIFIIPYWSRPYLVSGLRIILGDEEMVLSLDDERLSYAGLPSWSDRSVTLHDDWKAICARGSYFYGVNPSDSYAPVLFDPDLPNTPAAINKAVTWLHVPGTSLRIPAMLSKVAKSLHIEVISESVKNSTVQPWSDFLFSMFLDLAKKEKQLGPALTELLLTISPDAPMREKLARAAAQRGWMSLAGDLLSPGQIQVVQEIDPLTSTQQGYAAVRKSGGLKLVTNFTLSVRRNILYPDTGEVFHEVDVAGPSTFKALLATTEISMPKIETALRRAAVLAGLEWLPSLLDKTMAKPLTAMLCKKVSVAPSCNGTALLGWNAARTKFVTPGIIGTDEYLPHPEHEILKNFNLVEPGDPLAVPGDWPVSMRLLANISAALMTRMFHHQPVRAIPLKANAESQAVCRAFFGALGQTDILAVNTNSPPQLNGYPAWAYTADEDALEGLFEPLFFSCSQGLLLADEIGQAPVAPVIRAVANWLLENPQSGMGTALPQNFTKAVHQLAQEGSQLLHGLYGDAWPVINSSSSNILNFPAPQSSEAKDAVAD